MTEVRFYHLERQSLEQALPALAAKAYEKGHRVLIRTADEAEAERLCEALWTYEERSFLPHGTKKDGSAQAQPIWLSAVAENPNGADVLILTGSVQDAAVEGFSLCCDILDGRDETAVAQARERWNIYKEQGFEVTYWQQGERGWEKK